jgi:tetratricopeptide (TPR) repeat protein
MTSPAPNSNETQIVYQQDGERKTMSESQTIYMIEQIAQTDLKRALHYYHHLSNENPHAEQLLWKFYDTLLNMYFFEDLLEITNLRLQKIPSCAISFSWKIEALQHMFRNEEAVELLSAVARGNPDNISSWSNLGSFQKDIGDFTEAERSFRKALKINPAYAPAYWSVCEFSADPRSDLKTVQNVICGNQVPEDQNHYLHFAAYRLCEKLGQFEEAFEHLQLANAMKRRTMKLDVQVELDIDLNAKEVFSPQRMSAIEAAPESDLHPIFIMGMPRSGTTLVEQIIASHSDVAGGDEYTALANAVMRAQRQSNTGLALNDWLSSRETKDWHNIGRLYEQNMRYIRKDKLFFTDKNQFNHRSIGLIKASLANAKIIVVDRNPMDVAFGCYRQLFGGDGVRFSYQFDELAKSYASYMGLIDHWQSVTDGLIMRVKYEDLVHDQERVSKEMLSFCGLEWQDSCLEFYNTQRSVKTLSAQQVRQPIFTQGIDRWKQYELQLAPMMKELQAVGLI